MSAQYEQDFLTQQTKRQLREIMEQMGLAFENGMSSPDCIKAILAKQEADRPKKPENGNGKANRGNADQAQNAKTAERQPQPEVTVISGASTKNVQGAGKSVARLRSQLGQVLNIDPVAEPRVNGEVVNEEYVLNPGDRLEFVKKSGDKAF